MTKTEIFFH